ncbi:hypothetical protein EVAR_54527_1 [Eumeta japonica]|uniref:Uncharacterized protein n=1 Tax=Eumeta variegata TaxID=151549 RepID=A0A4C1YKB7_EUMVA|nr:hypothetical protein EVAR_54527_1 [Eumeta japonica]
MAATRASIRATGRTTAAPSAGMNGARMPIAMHETTDAPRTQVCLSLSSSPTEVASCLAEHVKPSAPTRSGVATFVRSKSIVSGRDSIVC